ncbi:hypothetical protein MTO96_031990, partial [Rhipicephalus appendiculatus]
MEPPDIRNHEAQLTNTVQGPFCFTAWYHQSGSGESPTNFYALTGDAEPYFWFLGPPREALFYTTQWDMTGEWQRVRYSEKRAVQIKIKFECTIKGNYLSFAVCAIDAIRVQGCESKRVAKENFCDFENGWCTWKNYEMQLFLNNPSWILGGGSTKTTLKRPPQDHTFGNAT